MRVPCFPLSKELLFSTYCSMLNITDLQNISKSLVLFLLKHTPQTHTITHTHTAYTAPDLSFIAKRAPCKRIVMYLLLYFLVTSCLPPCWGLLTRLFPPIAGAKGLGVCPVSLPGLVGREEGRTGSGQLFLQG